jgi:glutaredoxin
MRDASEMRSILLLAILLPSIASAEQPSVIMYGAAWCGPCGAVKAFMTQNRVPFEYVDIDTEPGRQRYEAARGGYRGIPLTIVNGQSIRGANLQSLAAVLIQAKLLASSAPPPAGSESYGGHSPAWWQAQFRQLRGQLVRMDQEVARGEKEAADHYDKELLAKLKDDREIVSQSIDQLETDASNVSLPRKYRE